MQSYVLKNEKKGLYLKSIDNTNETIEFTDNVSEAKLYNQGQWFGDTELEFAQFHFPNEKEILSEMKCVVEEIPCT